MSHHGILNNNFKRTCRDRQLHTLHTLVTILKRSPLKLLNITLKVKNYVKYQICLLLFRLLRRYDTYMFIDLTNPERQPWNPHMDRI